MHNFIEVDIPPEMLVEATKEAEQLGSLRNSITSGEGNVCGIIGEMVVEKQFGYIRKNTRDYDLVNPKDSDDTADVKSKRCTSIPEAHFDNSIAAYNTQQKCKKYIFVRVRKDYKKAWICGELTKEEYFSKATFVCQGQYDPRNHWRCKADCYNVSMENLNPPKSLVS